MWVFPYCFCFEIPIKTFFRVCREGKGNPDSSLFSSYKNQRVKSEWSNYFVKSAEITLTQTFLNLNLQNCSQKFFYSILSQYYIHIYMWSSCYGNIFSIFRTLQKIMEFICFKARAPDRDCVVSNRSFPFHPSDRSRGEGGGASFFLLPPPPLIANTIIATTESPFSKKKVFFI